MRKLTPAEIDRIVTKVHKGQVKVNWAKTGSYTGNRQIVWAMDLSYGEFQIRIGHLMEGQSPFSSRISKEKIDKKIKSLYGDKVFIDWKSSPAFEGRLIDKVTAIDKEVGSWETTVRFLFKKVLSKEHYYQRKTIDKKEVENRLKSLNLTIDWNKNKKFKNTKSKVLLKDPEYGEFKVKLIKALRGGKHPKRAIDLMADDRRLTREEIDKRIKSIFKGNVFIDWSKNEFEYKDNNQEVIATDIEYGDWKTKISRLLNGKGNRERELARRRWSKEELDREIKKKFSGTVKILWDKNVDYKGIFQKVIAHHEKYGEWEIRLGHLLSGVNHPKIVYKFSKGERQLSRWIKSLGVKVEQNPRFVIDGKTVEADIYIPSKKLAIEYNGLYWHSDLYQKKDYHSNKRELFSKKGIEILQFWDSEWLYSKHKVKQVIKKILEPVKSNSKEIVEPNRKEAKDFLNKNSLKPVSSRGLFKSYKHKKDLAFVVQYEVNNKVLNILNYASKGVLNEVILLNRFISEFRKIESIENVILNEDLRLVNIKKLKRAGFYLISSKNRRWKTNGKAIFLDKKPRKGKIFNIFDAGQGKFLKKL